MIAISMRSLQKLTFTMPRCTLRAVSPGGPVLVRDRKGDDVAEIDFYTGVITIYDNYQYVNEVLEALRQKGEIVSQNKSTEVVS